MGKLNKNQDGPAAVRSGGMGKRAAAFLGAFFLMVLLVSETIVMVSYVTPTLAILLFQYGQISIDRTITIADFAMGDAVILMMMWGAPLLVMCGLVTAVQWKIMKRGAGLVWRLVLISMGRGRQDSPGGKGDVQE